MWGISANKPSTSPELLEYWTDKPHHFYTPKNMFIYLAFDYAYSTFKALKNIIDYGPG